MIETELQLEMRRYIQLTTGWSGPHKFKVLCAWMGTLRLREMNDFLSAQRAEEAKLHSDAKPGGEDT